MNTDVLRALEYYACTTPDAVALDCDGLIVTYRELDRWSAGLSEKLVENGVKPGDAVAIRAANHNEFVASALSVWRVGAWFVVVREGLPPYRLEHVLNTTGACAVMLSPGLTPLEGVPVVELIRHSADPRPWIPTDDLAAYACFTSGTTGLPKGVLVPHRSLQSFIGAIVEVFDLRAEPFMSGAEDDWDGSIISTWAPLLVGGASVSTLDRLNPESMVAQMARTGTTRVFFATAIGEAALRRGPMPDSLRDVLLGGDTLRVRPPQDAGYRLWNVYGPTEATVAATVGQVGTDTEVITIGHTLPGSEVEILGESLGPLPDGETGQLAITGRLSWGYLGEPRRTATAFSAGPNGEYRYLTGDRARILPDGQVQLLGREDHQVSLHGRRVELAGVTAVLREVAGTPEVLVTTIGEGEDVRLVAFVVSPELDAAALRKDMGRRLHAGETPDQIIAVATLPADDESAAEASRQALAADRSELRPEHGTEDLDPIDQCVLEVWADQLGLAQPRLDDDLFDSGGTSLKAIHIVQELQEAFEVTLVVTEFLTQPSPRALAGLLRGALFEQIDALSEDERKELSAEGRE